MNRFILRRITHLDSRARDLDRRDAALQALETRQELCELAREHFEDGHPWLVDRWLELADNHRQLNQLDQAEQTYTKILGSLERQPRQNPLRIAEVLNSLGVCRCEAQRPETAVGPLRRALRLVVGQPVEDHVLATLHNNLASAFHSCGDQRAAHDHYRQALEVFTTLAPSLAEAHCHCDLAELLAEEEEEEEALLAIEKARRLFEALYESGSTDQAAAFLRVADLYCRLACFQLARPLLEHATEAFARSDRHSVQHSRCLSILSQLESEAPLGS